MKKPSSDTYETPTIFHPFCEVLDLAFLQLGAVAIKIRDLKPLFVVLGFIVLLEVLHEAVPVLVLETLQAFESFLDSPGAVVDEVVDLVCIRGDLVLGAEAIEEVKEVLYVRVFSFELLGRTLGAWKGDVCGGCV